MQVDIYIREKNGDREIRIPILPERFSFPCGDATFITTNIMYPASVPSATPATIRAVITNTFTGYLFMITK